MSSTTSAPSSTISLTTPTGKGNGNGGTISFGASSTLYLYTFLATLVLLLGVSVAIVMRSLVLRRRHRRTVEEAIRNGTFHPGMLNPALDARDRRWRSALNITPTAAEKPEMFDTHLGVPEEPVSTTPKWSFLPLSAAFALPGGGDPAVPPAPWTLELQSASQQRPWRSRLPAFARRSAAPASTPSDSASTPAATKEVGTPESAEKQEEEPRLNLTVLIAMPTPPTARRSSSSMSTLDREKGKQRASQESDGRPSAWIRDEDEEGEVPDVVFGVTQVRVGPDAKGLYQ